jgi:uroporphyrinogen decarboxylase
MRQAGRYLPEYRQVRETAGSFLDLCYRPELACQVSLQPLRRYDLDAAILFADILVVPNAMGLPLRFEEGEGPVLDVVRDMDAVRRLKSVAETPEVRAVCHTVGLVSAELPARVALIGFCGGPWTVASYMIEGRSSDRQLAKLAAFERAEWFVRLIDMLVEESVVYLSAQISAGAEAVQIFDSWAGDLAPGLRADVVEKPLGRLVSMLREKHPGVPVIVFARGVGAGHERIQSSTKAEAIGIESELCLDWAARVFSERCVIQGNLDPVALLGSDEVARREAVAVAAAVSKEKHIFNLGHGIKQGTRPEALSAVIEAVRSYDDGVVG